MKTKLLVVAMWASVVGVQAQGLVLFNNNQATRISTNSFLPGAMGLTSAAPNVYYFALFYSTTATTVLGTTNAQMPEFFDLGVYAFQDPNWTFAAYGSNLSSAPGRFSSSAQNPDGSTTINGVPGGATAQFVVLGWSASLGTNLAALEYSLATWANFGWIGESAVSGPLLLGDGGIIPPTLLFGSNYPFIQGFTLGGIPLVPEPSTLALAAFAIVGTLCCRRKRYS
jgi:hypothetical protein